MALERDGAGQFAIANKYGEPLSKKVIGLRLPESVYERLIIKYPGKAQEFIRDLVVTHLAADN